MFPVYGTPASPDWLSFEPEHVLYEFDGPRMLTCRAKSGALHLAYLCDEEAGAMRFLVVPFDERSEELLTTGQITVRQALAQSDPWLFDVDGSWQAKQAWRIDLQALPEKVLPMPGALLWSHLKPQTTTANGHPQSKEAAPATSLKDTRSPS